MFISFGMYIALIILTIIMIMLIIYLTFTGGHKKTHQDNIHQAEEAAKEKIAQNNAASLHLSNDFNQIDSNLHDNFKQESYTENHYYQETKSEETIEDDYSLHVLPYPKDDEFK